MEEKDLSELLSGKGGHSLQRKVHIVWEGELVAGKRRGYALGLCHEKVRPPGPQFPLLHWTGAGAVSLDGTSESAGGLLIH